MLLRDLTLASRISRDVIGTDSGILLSGVCLKLLSLFDLRS